MNKPIKPEITIPQSFAENGIKTDFDDDLLAQGFDNLRPDVLAGDNLNKFIDDTYKGLNYGMAAADAINLINEGETLTVVDGKLTSGASGGGLEIGDVAFTQMAIDETKGKRRKLNGQIIIQEQYQELTNILKASIAQNPDMACTEQEWQAEVAMSTAGICYKFVVDDVGGTIRLPKYPNYFIGGLANIAPVVGNGMALGLTNGTITGGLGKSSGSHALVPSTNYGKIGSAYGTAAGADSILYGVVTNPENSGIEAQIKQEKIVGTYYIQVATGAETEDNIINTLELNNPYSLFDSKYTEALLYNVSWLLANGSYNGSNAVHPSAYQALLVENNAEVAIGSTVMLPIGIEYTKRGLSVKLSTDSNITNYDFVLNTSNETFRLPIKVNLASGKAVVGNGLSLGLTDGTTNVAIYEGTISNQTYLNASSVGYGTAVGTNGSGTDLNNGKNLGVTLDPTKTGIETSDNGLYLYFYVGETVQNANIVNLGRIEEKLSTIIPDNAELITSYGIPPYDDNSAVAINTNWTATFNCIVVVYWAGNDSYGRNINVNNKRIFSNNVRTGYGNSGWVLCPKGATVDFDTRTGFELATAYPLKGVI